MSSKVKSAAKTPAKAVHAPKRTTKALRPPVEKTGSGAGAKKPKVAKVSAASARKPAAKTVKAKVTAERVAKPAMPKPKAEKAAAKAKKAPAKARGKKEPEENLPTFKTGGPVLDPIGDTTDGEGRTYLGEAGAEAGAPEHAESRDAEVDAFRKETRLEASDAILEAGPGMEASQEAMEKHARDEAVETAATTDGIADVGGPRSEPREPQKLDRLQKILSQAGIASRRRAEEMITEGRVMVNGQVVTTLGTKADVTRDHIRVNGKLLHGAERHRHFLLNKPRGYVTTVSDPEGRPTVMDLVAKASGRLYPVGRLDYQSEGLLLMTNDGELANLLTKAGSGVEKIYLVKVAGQPTEEELERLRGGVTIDRGEPGSGRVRTAPARVRQVRVGDNPWFEVVLTEGRNRELRKMFSAVGHFVEKIRRVGYGPLALDVEPGKMRELTADEVRVLRLTAEGKMKPKRLHADRMLPKDAGLAAEKRFEKRGGRGGRDFARRQDASSRPGEGGSFERLQRREPETRDSGGFRPREGGGFEKREGGASARRDDKAFGPRGERGEKREFRPRGGEFRGGPRGGFGDRRQGQVSSSEKRGFEGRQGKTFGAERGAGKPGASRERQRFEGGRPFGGGRPPSGPGRGLGRPQFDRPRPDKPRFDKPGFSKPGFQRRGFDGPRPGGLRIEKVEFEKRSPDRPRFDGPRFDKPRRDNPGFGGRPDGQAEGRQEGGPRKPFRPQGDRPGGFKRPNKPGGSGRPKSGFGGRPGGFGGPRQGGRGGSRPSGGRPNGGRFGGKKRG
ncbi:MAG: pseudouridine synthase [Terracidiphilus sp.]|jgi:23S rRNA pseudouridine2605 synthase